MQTFNLENFEQVTASSPRCRFTDAKALTSRNFVRVNKACPNRDGIIWWQADLGAQHSLACNYYTLRADASGNCLHDWELQVCTIIEPAPSVRRIQSKKLHDISSIAPESMHIIEVC